MQEFVTPLVLRSSRGEVWNISIVEERPGSAFGNLTFNANLASGGITRMVINDDTGNVGIGTTAPRALLDVNGTFRVNNGTVFSQIQAGTATVGNSSSERKNIVVNFRGPFDRVPQVMATARGGNFPDTFAVTTTAISNRQFNINVLRLDRGSGWGQNLQLDWIAWDGSNVT